MDPVIHIAGGLKNISNGQIAQPNVIVHRGLEVDVANKLSGSSHCCAFVRGLTRTEDPIRNNNEKGYGRIEVKCVSLA